MFFKNYMPFLPDPMLRQVADAAVETSARQARRRADHQDLSSSNHPFLSDHGSNSGMADQTTVKPGSVPRHESNGVVGGVSALGSNVVNLAILQTRLTVLDLIDTSRKSLPAIIGLVVVLLALPSALVVGAIGLASGSALWRP